MYELHVKTTTKERINNLSSFSDNVRDNSVEIDLICFIAALHMKSLFVEGQVKNGIKGVISN